MRVRRKGEELVEKVDTGGLVAQPLLAVRVCGPRIRRRFKYDFKTRTAKSGCATRLFPQPVQKVKRNHGERSTSQGVELVRKRSAALDDGATGGISAIILRAHNIAAAKVRLQSLPIKKLGPANRLTIRRKPHSEIAQILKVLPLRCRRIRDRFG